MAKQEKVAFLLFVRPPIQQTAVSIISLKLGECGMDHCEEYQKGVSMEEASKKENMARYQRRRKIVSVCSLIILIAFFVGITLCVGKPMIENLRNPEGFRAWVDDHGPWGRLVFSGMMTLQVVVAMIPGEPLEIAAGYVFGNIEGVGLCLLGAAMGTAVIFGFTKIFGVKMVEAFVSREKIESIRFLHNPEKRNILVFILFFIPGTPKDVITYFIGLTSMRLHTFLLLSSIGRIPSIITSTVVGNALGSQNYMAAVLVFVVTGLAAAIGMWIYHVICNKKAHKNNIIVLQE